MNLAGWRFLLFALAGAGAIVLLASVGTPGKREEAIDRHTGERVRVVRNVADAVAEARAKGNARAALASLRHRLEEFPGEAVLEQFAAVFEAELADGPPSPAHPEAAVVAAEQERARRLREELDRRLAERLDREALLALLSDLEADSAVGQATEAFFAPLARWRPEHPPTSARADELAARILVQLEEPGPHDPALILEAVRAYQAENRPRARLRWLLRGFAAHPGPPLYRDLLLNAYLERGRVREAFLVLGTALLDHPDDLALWEMRARMAGWLSLYEAEIEAREKMLGAEDTRAARERLIELYRYVGRPGGAVEHALALASGSTDPADLERPAQLALAAGDVDRALELLGRLADVSRDERYWREKIVAYASQDLRTERVIAELDHLRRGYPEGDYEERLEGIYRRLNDSARLVALLDERLARRPDDAALEDEVMALHAALGNERRVKELLGGRIRRQADPRTFFAELATYRALELPGLEDALRDHAIHEKLRPEDAAFVLDRLLPWLDDPAYASAAGVVARRFPADPTAQAVLVQLVDREPDDALRTDAAARLARAHPGELAFVKVWIERASWSGNLRAEIEAREVWRSYQPEDPGNLRALADLYGTAERPADALVLWRTLAAQDGLESESTLRLVEALFATGEYDEAVAWLEKRANLPHATLEERLSVAEQLFSNERFDRALHFYTVVLDLQPEHTLSLLRVGQIRSWTNDPRGAIPFFERRLAVSEEARAEVQFYLGEAYWSIRENERARRLHRLALDDLSKRETRTLEQDVMVAKMLVRFDRIPEAQPIFEHVLRQIPGDVNIILDYADSMAAVRNGVKARELVDRAKALQTGRARTMRLDGKVLLLERRYEEAVVVLEESMRRHGPEAGAQSELGRAYELSGRPRSSAEAYRRSLLLQPENRDVSAALQQVADDAARLLHASAGYRRAGQDRVAQLWAQATLPLEDERTRLGAALGFAAYSGRAEAVNAGTTDVEEEVLHLQLSAFHRFRRLNTVAGGVTAYAGAPGDLPLGAWAGLRLLSQEPFRTLELDVHGNLLLEDPAAAVGLGGRRSGARASFSTDLGTRFSGTVQLAYESLGVDVPGGSTARDGQFRGGATLGWRILDGGQRVPDALDLRRSSLPGVTGTHLLDPPAETPGPLVSVWVTYEAVRLLDDRELTALIPVGARFDYLTLGARGDFHLAPAWGAKVEGYFGIELESSDPIFGVEAGLAWRPSHRLELTALAGYGSALGRADDADSFLLRLGFSYRW